ncbi:MAG: helix-turn-helix domain-containing protein [Lachnospiraceae bacterium]|nr:helix-turn-helix domain-containing protein [Lachnospiraceae bacterium]
MLENTPGILTLKELMQLLHIGKNNALRLIHDRIIEAHKISGKWLILKSDIEEYIHRS